MRFAVMKATVFALAGTVFLGLAQVAGAQNLFEPLIRVNEQAITRFEIEQRARMLTLFRTPGDPIKVAREQLIEDRLKLGAAKAMGLEVAEGGIQAAMEEFAARGDLSADQMIDALASAGVEETSFRDFVRVGVTWREVIRARFAGSVAVKEDDVERAKLALSGSTGVRVLLSEIVLPLVPERIAEMQQRAQEISEIESISAFADAARRYSASPSAASGGKMEWTRVDQLPEPLQPVVLALSPGEVSDPLPTERAIVLIQLRDIAETASGKPQYSSIDYAAYYIEGGRSDQALARAAQVRANVDTCDDLYGIAKDQPRHVLDRENKDPKEIPQDISRELARLDPGEVSTNLTRSNGQVLVFLMLCERTPKVAGEGPSPEELTNFIRNRRLESYANGFLEQLRAEARIYEK